MNILSDLSHCVIWSSLNCFATYLFPLSITTFINIQQKNSLNHRKCEFRYHLSSQNFSDFKRTSLHGPAQEKWKWTGKLTKEELKKSFPPWREEKSNEPKWQKRPKNADKWSTSRQDFAWQGRVAGNKVNILGKKCLDLYIKFRSGKPI